MGFYFRKSVKIGPIRVNFSKSGIGLSTGVKGFRVGSGPRGNYIHLGTGGFYYKKQLSRNKRPDPVAPVPIAPSISHYENFVQIESGDADLMRDSSFDDILNEINMKYARPMGWWALLAASPIIAIVLYSLLADRVSGATGWAWLSILICAALSFIIRAIEIQNKTTYLIYDIDQYEEEKIQKFYDAFEELKACVRKCFVTGRADLSGMESKKNMGATGAIEMHPTNITNSTPKYIYTNITTPAIPVGKQTLYFFPERVLVVEKRKVGTVNYADLKISFEDGLMAESRQVPADADIVDETWKYTNKKGGPDMRFKDNVKFPICKYSYITFNSDSGLNEQIQLSRHGLGADLVEALKNYTTSNSVHPDKEFNNDGYVIPENATINPPLVNKEGKIRKIFFIVLAVLLFWMAAGLVLGGIGKLFTPETRIPGLIMAAIGGVCVWGGIRLIRKRKG